MESRCFYPIFRNFLLVNHIYESPCFYDGINFFNYNYNDEEYFTNEVNDIKNNNEYNSTFSESNTSIINKNITKKDESLNLTSTNLDPKIYFNSKKKKRPGKIRVIFTDKKPYLHSKNKFDNMLTKIQVGYINFLVNFTNIIIEKFGRSDLKFKLIVSSLKKNNKIESRKKLKEGTIADVLKNEISSKYSKINKNNNFIVYEDLVKSGLTDVINVLKQKFLFFFEPVYFKSLRKFNLKDFGLIDLQIELPKKILLYEDLLMKNKKDGNFEEYKIKMEKCIKWHFLGGLEADEKLKEI